MEAFNAKFPDKKTTIIETLTRTFGDDNVAWMLSVAKKKDGTQTLASKLEAAQLEMWWNSKKSLDDVLKLLKLDRPGLDLAEHPLFNLWVSYMNRFAKQNPNEVPTLLSKLQGRFKERHLSQILLLAKRFPSMESATIYIQTGRIERLMASNESPKKAFSLLALDKVGDDILSDPLFQMWMKLVKEFNKKNPERQESGIPLPASRRSW